MSSSSSNVTPASIVAGFPIKTLSLLATAGVSIPTFSTLTILQRELNDNAASVHSNLGDGNSGHLVLTYPPVDFAALPGHIAFITPNNPGQNPVVPAGSTVEQIRVIIRAHSNDLLDFNTYRSVDNALKQLLLAACPLVFLAKLQHPNLGFARISTLAMLTHLWDTYGRITPADIMANNQALMTVFWHPPVPIEELFTEISKLADYAVAGGAPISDIMIVQAAYNNIEATGLFTDDCKVWRNRDPVLKTYALLIEFFTRADLDRTRVTASSAGYHVANSAVVATAAELLNLQAKVATLEKQLSNRPTNAQRRAANAFAAAKLLAAGATGGGGGGKLSYCWTHGSSTNSRHTSATCKSKAEFHQDGATMENKMGGSEYVYSAADARPRLQNGE